VTRSERLYRLLLRAYPLDTRRAYGEDMVQLFADQLRDAGSVTAQGRVWVHAARDVIATAPQERLAGRPSRQLVEGQAVSAPRPLLPDLFAAAAPLLLLALMLLVAPGFYQPLFDERIGLLGLPFGLSMTIGLGTLAVLGIFGARRGGLRNRTRVLLALALLCAPAPLLLLTAGPLAAITYLALVAAVLIAAGSRVFLAAMALPFLTWLVLGPALVQILMGLSGPE
jgi:hypothetical protein